MLVTYIVVVSINSNEGSTLKITQTIDEVMIELPRADRIDGIKVTIVGRKA